MAAEEGRFPEIQLTEEEIQAGFEVLRARWGDTPDWVLTRMLAEKITVGMAEAGFPVREPEGEPMMVAKPCGCTSMVIDGQPVQVSWCDPHDPGYTPPGGEQS